MGSRLRLVRAGGPAQDLALGDSESDAASCSCGLMFCADPASTVSQVRREVLARGGLSDIAVERCSLTFELQSVDHYWNVMMQFAAGIAQKVARLPPEAVARARAALHRAARPHLQAERLRLAATALCASGRAAG